VFSSVRANRGETVGLRLDPDHSHVVATAGGSGQSGPTDHPQDEVRPPALTA
jgi:hypothetical protein